MYRESWWLVEVQKWILRTIWGIVRTIVTGLLMVVVAVAAATNSFVSTVLWPAAVHLTRQALVRIEIAFLDHPTWPWLGLFPYRKAWQRFAVAAVVWSAGALFLLVMWFVTSALLAGRMPRLPLPSRVALLLIVSGILGVAAAASRNDNRGGGISLG